MKNLVLFWNHDKESALTAYPLTNHGHLPLYPSFSDTELMIMPAFQEYGEEARPNVEY